MNKLFTRTLAAAAVAGCAVTALSTGAAGADTYIPLPDGQTVNPIGDGSVTVRISNQHAVLSPGQVALPTTRNAWVSGMVTVDIAGTNPGNGSIHAGYLVGCQVNLSSANVGLSGSANSGVSATYTDSTGQFTTAASPSGSGKATSSISAKAGGIYVEPIELAPPNLPKAGDSFKPDVEPPGNGNDIGANMGFERPTRYFPFKGRHTSTSFSDVTIGIDGCAGYAQARFYAYTTAKVGTNEGFTVLWGKPFTLG
jgi:hypothetical protein